MAIAPLRTGGPSRDRLVRSALRLFAERGYSGVSNREIVEDCGLTKGAIYWYFESKQDLFRTVLSEALSEFQGRLAAALQSRPTWDGRLAAMFGLFIEVLDADDDPHRDLLFLLVNRQHRGAGADRLVGTAHDRLVGWLEQVVSERDGPPASRDLATLVHAAGLGVLGQAAAGYNVARPALGALLALLGGGDLEVPAQGSPAVAHVRGQLPAAG